MARWTKSVAKSATTKSGTTVKVVAVAAVVVMCILEFAGVGVQENLAAIFVQFVIAVVVVAVVVISVSLVIAFVIAVVMGAVVVVHKYRKATLLRKYQKAANNVAAKERLGHITDKEKTKFISVIRVTISKLIDKDVINPEETADLIRRIERGCIQLSQASSIIGSLLDELPSANMKKSFLKKIMKKLDELEKAYRDGFFSDADFEKKVGDIIIAETAQISPATAQAAIKESFLSNANVYKTAGMLKTKKPQ